MAKQPPPQTEASKATRFQKGDTGNKKGRNKKLPALEKLLIEVLGGEDDQNSEAKKILTSLLKRAKNGDARCAEILLDRAYGKSAQPIISDSEVTVTIKHG